LAALHKFVTFRWIICPASRGAGPVDRVTGFGCRPINAIDTRTTGPAFESRQGRKARDWGTQFSRRYGDLVGAVGSAWALRSRQRWCGWSPAPVSRPDHLQDS